MSHIGNINWNLVTGEIYCSDELRRILKYDNQKPGPTFEEYLNYIYADDRNRVENSIEKAFNGESLAGEYSIFLSNGEERKIFSIIKVIFNEKKCPVLLKGTFQDITELNKSEEKIRNLANIVESSNEAILTISTEGNITSWNKGAEKIYGY